MTQSLEIDVPLTSEELKQVKDFADFLVSRRAAGSGSNSRGPSPTYVNVDAIMGLCKGMGGDKSNKELIREAWDAVIDKLER